MSTTNTILDELRADAAPEPSFPPAGPGGGAGAGAGAAGTLPPPAPCAFTPEPVDLFAPPPAPCGCPLFWLDSYGRVRCCACSPPLHPALVRRRLAVILADNPAGYAWLDAVTRQPIPDGSQATATPEAAERAYSVLCKVLGDERDGWLIIKRRDARDAGPPIDQTFDAWWRENEARQAAAWQAWEWAREFARTGQHVGMPPERGAAATTSPAGASTKKENSRRSAAARKNKNAAGENSGRVMFA